MCFGQRTKLIEIGTLLKNSGNYYFKKQDFVTAKVKYNKSLK